jgi:hypothetical protein
VKPGIDGDSSARSRLVFVRRLCAFVLALTVAGSSAAASSMHVHAYGGHDHLDHQHGPASHRHDHDQGGPAEAVDDHYDGHDDDHHDDYDDQDGRGHDDRTAAARVEACDPGEHAIRIPRTAGPLPQIHLQLAVLPGAVVVAPATPVRVTLAPLDVRVHGPPADIRLPARAPPLTPLA